MKTLNFKKISKQALWLATLIAILVWSLAPFIWQVITSFKAPDEVFRDPPTYWPSKLVFSNYIDIFRKRPFGTYIFNSVIVALGTTLLCSVVGSLCAYALARLKLPGSKWLLAGIVIVAVFPPTLLVIPLYQMFKFTGMLNHPLALIIPYSALNLPFAILVLTVFFRQIPKEIEEAAQVDGFTNWGILWKIIVPLSIPAVATVAILIFIFSWNEFLLALTFMIRDNTRTVPVGIAMLSGASQYEVPWSQISAAVVLTTLPVVAMVVLFQKRIVEGLTAGAVKG